MVFSLSEGRLDSAHLLHDLCRNLPWEKITAAKDSAEHRSWFDISGLNIISETNVTHE